jgi:hypothetical protein
MVRREMGAWLPIGAVVAGLVLYAAGMAIFWFVDFSRYSPEVFLTALACVIIGPLLLSAVCAWSSPWWRFGGVAVSLFCVQFFLIVVILNVQNWRHGRDPLWQVCEWVFAVCACIWFGCREFLKVRKAMLAAKETGESH